MMKKGAEKFCTTPFPKGSSFILARAVGGYKAGDIGVVVDTQGQLPNDMVTRPDWNYTVEMAKDHRRMNLYQREMMPASRAEQIKLYRNQITHAEAEIEFARKQIESLEHYKDYADFVAHKIKDLMDKGKDTEAIREMLIELGLPDNKPATPPD